MPTSFSTTVLRSWERLQTCAAGASLELDGQDLQIADVVATALYDVAPEITSSQETLSKIEGSVSALGQHLKNGWYVYGVNTGFGGSADTRTDQVVTLQAALMQLTQAGILAPNDLKQDASRQISGRTCAMPTSWVRAAITVRCNATIRGHSAVSLRVVQAVIDLIKHNLVPVVPLRGTVSASGDLMPLSYIAGAAEGNPDIFVEDLNDPDGRVVSSDRALHSRGLKPIQLGPKEGLGLVNGTASSAALGALVAYRINQQSLLIQALSAMAVEALQGSAGSFHPFISQVRPHPGQIEVSRNISTFLTGSKLARTIDDPRDRRPGDLMQDRYSLRSAPQWIGPQLEDLALAERQITVELSSSCDNPLINTEGQGSIHYGCNFQAAAVTSAMEKTRLSAQILGRLLFSQLTEMVDPSLSGGLPPNLAADDPSLSFALKGVDIAMASYMAEISYLANPMSSHVQPAEMHNQSLNSMAFASARMGMQAMEILAHMCANHLYACCQAVDLRALHQIFMLEAEKSIEVLVVKHLSAFVDQDEMRVVQTALATRIPENWKTSAKLDATARSCRLAESLAAVLLDVLPSASSLKVSTLKAFQQDAHDEVYRIWQHVFQTFCAKPPTEQYLGAGGKVLYRFVRDELQVPFHQGLIEHPKFSDVEHGGRAKKTIGGWLSIINEALLDGRSDTALMSFLRTQSTNGESNGINGHVN